MSIEVERLLVTLEARVDQYEKNLAKASGTTDTQLGAIENRGKRMEASLLASTSRGVRGFDALGKSVKGSEIQVGNLAAQFNDIGVQLAGGQSPFLIALQQGSQITQAFGAAGVRGALLGVGGALASLVSPMSLLTIGLITAGGFAVQYFADLISGGKEAELTLQEQESLIERVAKRWGEAVPGLKAYADEMQRVKDAGELEQAGGIKLAEDQAEINRLLDEFLAKNEDVVAAINMAYDATGRSDTALSKLAAKWLDLEAKIRAGTATQADFNTATSLMQSAVAAAGGDMDGFATDFETLETRIRSALGALQEFSRQLLAVQTKASIFPARPEFTTTNNAPDLNFPLPNNGPVPEDKPSLLDYDPNATGGRKGSKADPYADATRSLTERTAALEAQAQAQAKLNPLVNDYGYAVEYAKTKQDLLTAAQKGGREITPELAAEIDKLAAAYASTSAQIQKIAESSKNAAAALQFQKDLVGGVLSDMRAGLEDGKLSWEDLKNTAVNALNKIADKLQSMLVDQLFAKGFGGLVGSLTGVTGSVVGGLSGVGGVGAGALGAASAKAASAVSAQQIGKAQAMTVDLRTYVDENGNWQQKVERISGGVAARTMQAGLGTYRRNQLHNDIDSHMRAPRRRGSI